ncbi:hypothetical protein TNCV_824271 [Trichonephila clavipes]|nr:hypothetical protein TNCV_824271 [Trichonephila clavipes]
MWNKNSSISMLKHGGGCILSWVCKSGSGLDNLLSGPAGDQLSGRLQTTQNVAAVKKVGSLTVKDRHLAVQENAEQIEINTGSVNAILCDHARSSCEICSQNSVGGAENSILKLQMNFWILSMVNLAFGL